MNLISCAPNPVLRRVAPWIIIAWLTWFGVLYAGSIVFLGAFYGALVVAVVFLCSCTALVGVLWWKHAGVADEVWDDGNVLIVRKRDRDAYIPIGDVLDVDHVYWDTSGHMRIKLAKPCEFGSVIRFAMAGTNDGVDLPPEVAALKLRIDAGRKKANP